MRTLPVSRPTSFLPVYAMLVAGLHLWLIGVLTRAGRDWLVYDPAAPLRLVPVVLVVALGLAALALWIAAWIARRRGRRPMHAALFHASSLVSLIVLYALLHTAGYWFGYF